MGVTGADLLLCIITSFVNRTRPRRDSKSRIASLVSARFFIEPDRREWPAMHASDPKMQTSFDWGILGEGQFEAPHMICRSTCRPLNRSSIGMNLCISSSSPATLTFVPEPGSHQARLQMDVNHYSPRHFRQWVTPASDHGRGHKSN